MTLDKTPHIILQPRDRHLLDQMRIFRFVDYEQARAIAGFGSLVRTRTRLALLWRAGLLDRLTVGTILGGRKAIYSLVRRQRRRPSVSPFVSPRRTEFLAHELSVNEVGLAVQMGRVKAIWNTQAHPALAGSRIRPDGHIRANEDLKVFFVEVDMETESRTVWQRKISGYLQLARSGRVVDRLGNRNFEVLIVAVTEGRIRAIRTLIARSTDRVFYVATIDQIRTHGFWSPIWLRPTGEQRHALRS